MTPFQTAFAGYEVLAPGDPLSSDGYAFQFQNPQTADELDKIGAVTHRHDGHSAMANPTTAPTVSLATTGGALPSDTEIHIVYTLLDGSGGETLPRSPATVVTTVTGYATPGAPTVVADYTSGTLLAGTPVYGITVTDGSGGETELGAITALTVAPGHANAQALFSGLTALTNAASGSSTSAGWRVWRSVDGGSSYNLMGTGAYSTDTFADTGSSGDCSVSPPVASTTAGTSQLSVTIPATSQPAAATFFSIYADTTGLFLSPCLLGTYPVADYGSAQVYTSLAVSNGQPPVVSRSYPGANKIDPATDIDSSLFKPFQTGGLFSAGDLATAGTASGTLVPNHLVTQRVIAPSSGTLHDLSVFPTVQAGSLIFAVYDTGDAVTGIRTRLYAGTVACPAANAWGSAVDPGLVVTAGQALDIAVMSNNGTASLANWPSLSRAAFATLPTNFIPTAGAASPKMAWEYNVGSFASAGTVAEVSCGTIGASSVPVVIGRIA